ncbi:MAG: hypothetical protein BM562_15810 [Alphaproteobacteria bacterium MedPE-SWcel]|nr:MAG: hypothetical protein BM562_15810 [Alphaproteobacteria bacterium MedPE-SWcel]
MTGEVLEKSIRFLAGCAILAPSGHNTQPWLFASGPNWLDVIADRTRALAVVDPDDRELTISCGAAVGTFETAARRLSLQTSVARCPDPGFPDHLAQITVEDGPPPDELEVTMFDAIARRRTDRSAYFLEELPDGLKCDCRKIADPLGVNVEFFSDGSGLKTIADLVAEGDRIQFEDPDFRHELASWVHSSRRGSRDGMSGASFGLPDILAPAARFVIRTFDLGENIAAADAKKILAGSPTLALLSSTSDTVEDWLDTGRALARMLLLLTARGFTASYLNQPIEIATLRSELRQAAGATTQPQILLRIGRSERPPPPTMRRALSDVMITT